MKGCDGCAGIILNNQMDDFSTPDQRNTYGLPPSRTNFIRPFKKPQSSMSPMIVTASDGSLRAVLGASGGPRIISSAIQTLFRCLSSVSGHHLSHWACCLAHWVSGMWLYSVLCQHYQAWSQYLHICVATTCRDRCEMPALFH